jgi:hypothetical protein
LTASIGITSSALTHHGQPANSEEINAMGRSLHVVFSQRPPGVSDDEFNAWYDDHLEEVLAVPGFVAVQRFRLDPVVTDPDAPRGWQYLAVWEVEGDPDVAIDEQRKMGLSTKESYVQYREAKGGAPLPDWWDQVRFASWNAVPVSEHVQHSG